MEDKIIWENPNNLKIGENSRFRADSNLAELMESIKQNGILQPIVARKEDKQIIMGYRRWASAIKLGFEKVPVRYMEGIDDKTLLILNLTENIQRKDISSIEIGRICDIMVKNAKFKISISELAIAVGVPMNRIKTCVDAFKHLPAEFRDKVVHMEVGMGRKIGELPENIVFAILNFNRVYKKISADETKLLLKKASENLLSISQIALLGRLFSAGMPFKKAIKEIDIYTVMRIDLIAMKTELASVMKKEGISGKNALIIKIVKDRYPNLLY